MVIKLPMVNRGEAICDGCGNVIKFKERNHRYSLIGRNKYWFCNKECCDKNSPKLKERFFNFLKSRHNKENIQDILPPTKFID